MSGATFALVPFVRERSSSSSYAGRHSDWLQAGVCDCSDFSRDYFSAPFFDKPSFRSWTKSGVVVVSACTDKIIDPDKDWIGSWQWVRSGEGERERKRELDR